MGSIDRAGPLVLDPRQLPMVIGVSAVEPAPLAPNLVRARGSDLRRWRRQRRLPVPVGPDARWKPRFDSFRGRFPFRVEPHVDADNWDRTRTRLNRGTV